MGPPIPNRDPQRWCVWGLMVRAKLASGVGSSSPTLATELVPWAGCNPTAAISTVLQPDPGWQCWRGKLMSKKVLGVQESVHL